MKFVRYAPYVAFAALASLLYGAASEVLNLLVNRVDEGKKAVGIVVATLDAARVYQSASALPQNVNFVVKADYLLSLFAMLPGEALAPRTTSFTPEKAAQCVAIIRAW